MPLQEALGSPGLAQCYDLDTARLACKLSLITPSLSHKHSQSSGLQTGTEAATQKTHRMRAYGHVESAHELTANPEGKPGFQGDSERSLHFSVKS